MIIFSFLYPPFISPTSYWFPTPNSSLFLFMFVFFFRSSFLLWKKEYSICLSESGLFYLTWWSLLLSIFLKNDNFVLYGRITPHEVYMSHFLYPFISLMVTYSGSITWLLWIVLVSWLSIKLQWTFTCIFLLVHIFPSLGIELSGYIENGCFIRNSK
jgi:hypothetical protein